MLHALISCIIVTLIGANCIAADCCVGRSGVDPVSATNAALPASCAEAVPLADLTAESGVYQIFVPNSGLNPFFVYCLKDPNNGLAWTLIQRRQSGDTEFYRGWQDYKMGFGNLNEDFFIGLDKLHALTQLQLNELWIQLEDFNETKRFAKYESFAIGNENEKYAMSLLGAYSGDAGDSLAYHSGQKFSTYDQDNAYQPSNCSERHKGAWWYRLCHRSNLNGLYLKGLNTANAQGVIWYAWHGHQYSLKYTHMAIRPRKNIIQRF